MRIVTLVLFLCCSPPAWAGDSATVYFPVLPFDAAADTVPQVVPVVANHALDGVHAGVTRGIIVIHDDTRDASHAEAMMAALAGGANEATMIMAPQFLLPSDITRFAGNLPDKGRAFAAWEMTGWAQGDDSVATPPQKGISSFTVMDLLMLYLSDRKAFPDLQVITLAGYGAGANFVQRYAAFSFAAPVVARQNSDVLYLVAAPSSYLYLTSSRALGGRKGFGVPDTAACPDFNAYPYGFDKLNAYARRGGANAAKLAYASRYVVYLNAAVAATGDTGCAAAVQGSDNMGRAQNYKAYLQSLYGDKESHTHLFVTAKDTKADAASLFGSPCGMAVLFGSGSCPALMDVGQ